MVLDNLVLRLIILLRYLIPGADSFMGNSMNDRKSIRFRFDFEKFLNMVVYICERFPDTDILKMMKLIYFIDKHYVIREGRLITGDTYYRLDYGPVPSFSYDLLKELDSNSPLDNTQLPDKETLLNSLEITKDKGYPTFRAKTRPDLDCFSKRELESINSVLTQYGVLSGIELMNLSHQDPTHKLTPNRSPINMYLFFEGEPEAEHSALENMEIEQEDRDFVDGLT
jgi:uncharacterized phage-associated protein